MQSVLVMIGQDLLIAGLTALVVTEYFKTFFEKKNIKAVGLVIWLLYYGWQIIATYAMVECPPWIRMILSVLFVLISSCFFDGSFWAKVFFSILHIAIGMLGESITGCFFLLLDIPLESNMFIGSIASKIFLFVFVKALQPFFRNSAVRQLSWKMNLVLMLLPIGSMILVHHIFTAEYKLNQSDFKSITIMCMLIVLAINIVVFNLYIRLSEYMELKYKNSIYEKEFQLLDVHMKEKECVMQEFRRKRHDLKHQMTELLNLLKDRKYEELEGSIMELADLKSLEGLKIANTDNSIIDAFVNYKYEVAKRNGIDFCTKLDVPAKLPFANGDLCVILGNALDNALEANLRGKVENPYIDLRVKYDDGNLIMIIENSFDGGILQNRRGERMTRKADDENHGMGIGSIKNILKKYHGYYDVTIQGNTYCLNIILYSNTRNVEKG